MAQQQIVVTIDAQGEVKVEAVGVKGSGCQGLTAAIEKALGTVESDTKKAEFYQVGQCQVREEAKQNG